MIYPDMTTSGTDSIFYHRLIRPDLQVIYKDAKKQAARYSGDIYYATQLVAKQISKTKFKQKH